MTVIDDYYDSINAPYAKRQADAAELYRMYIAARDSLPAPDYSQSYAENNPNALWVIGADIFKGGNRGVGGTKIRLKGVSLASVIYEDAPALVAEVLADSTNYPGLNLIRLPVYGDDFDARTHQQKLEYIEDRLVPCVALAQAQSKYTILDYHNTGRWDSDSRVQASKSFATYMHIYFKDNPFVLLELHNEPTEPAEWPWPGQLSTYEAHRVQWQPVVDYYRYLFRNIVIVPTPAYSTRLSWAQTNPFAGDNLTYTFHAYPGFTGDYITYAGTTPSAAASAAVLANACPTNVPVMMTEGGYSTPDVGGSFSISGIAGGETDIAKDANYPQGLVNFLTARKNVHFCMWAYSVNALGLKNAIGTPARNLLRDSILPAMTP